MSADKELVNVNSPVMSTPKQVVANSGRSIGTILIQAGRLTLEDGERILRLQDEQGLRFGDAAIQLGLLTQSDIEFALSSQFGHTYLVRGESKVSEDVVCAYAPFCPQARAIGTLRSQLILRWFDSSETGKALAIVSAEHNEGRSFIAANLAVAFSQTGLKTLLIDADMRNPRQHVLFGLENRGGLSAMLSGRGKSGYLLPVAGLPGLSVLPSGVQPPNPLELLARPAFPQLLRELEHEFQVVLLDSPPSSEHSDAQTIAVRAGAALIVARKNFSRAWRVQGITDAVDHANATIIGTVLNEF